MVLAEFVGSRSFRICAGSRARGAQQQQTTTATTTTTTTTTTKTHQKPATATQHELTLSSPALPVGALALE